MIIGGSKKEVIANIKKAVEAGEFNRKAEMNDPVLTAEQSDRLVYGYVKKRGTLTFKAKSFVARRTVNAVTGLVNKDTVIYGTDKLKNIKGGAIVTCNHFNPLDNTTMRYMAKKAGGKRLFTVAKETNFAMTGAVGFIMNYADTVPISGNLHYTNREFSAIVADRIKKGDWVLIYPEQEMWFNYRKPRPTKPGAYYYAAKFNVPVISCFVEMTDTGIEDNDEFNKVNYSIHILDPLFPDKALSPRENCRLMQASDYAQKKAAYEKAYGKKLDYTFDITDIAGYKGDTPTFF